MAVMHDDDLSPLCIQDYPPSRPQLRVAVVTETYPPEVNGVAMTLSRLVDGLVHRGHQVQLVRPRQGRQDRGNASDVEEVLATGFPIPRYAGLRLGLPANRALIKTWSRQRPDVVHVVTEGPLGLSAVAAARKLQLPITSGFHTNFHAYTHHYGVGWLQRPLAAYLRHFHNRTDATLVPTGQLARELETAGYTNLRVLARGVDTVLFHPQHRSNFLRRSWGCDGDEPGLAVLCVGRMAPEKNLSLVLEAFEAIRRQRPHSRLIFVGDGPVRGPLQQHHPQHVYAGMRSGADLAAHYASADLFLFPSLTETFGNVALEALASGLPVVAFDRAAAGELIRSGENGFLAPPDDAAAFVAAAVAAATGNTLGILKNHARVSVVAQDWERIHDTFAQLLLQSVRSHARRHQARTAIVMAPD